MWESDLWKQPLDFRTLSKTGQQLPITAANRFPKMLQLSPKVSEQSSDRGFNFLSTSTLMVSEQEV